MRKTRPLTDAAPEDIRRADEALTAKIEAHKARLDPPSGKAERLLWAKAQAETGANLHHFAMFSRIKGAEAHFLSAAALLEAALEIVTPKSDLAGWVRIQMELGEVWDNSSRGAGATAIAARRRSAEIYKEILATLEGRKPRLWRGDA